MTKKGFAAALKQAFRLKIEKSNKPKTSHKNKKSKNLDFNTVTEKNSFES
jgi:stalled ribosome alternative rescue factor ArfA